MTNLVSKSNRKDIKKLGTSWEIRETLQRNYTEKFITNP